MGLSVAVQVLFAFAGLLATGLTLAGVLVWMGRRGKVRCVGRVVEHEAYEAKDLHGRRVTYHRAVFEYVLPDGAKGRLTTSTGALTPDPPEGTECVVYARADGSDAVLEEQSLRGLALATLALFGAALLAHLVGL